MESGKPLILVVLFLLVMVTGSKGDRDPLCTPISENLHYCSDVIRLGFLIGVPSPKCCAGLKAIKKTVELFGVLVTCHCVRNCAASHIMIQKTINYGYKAGPAAEAAPPSCKAPDCGGDIFILLQKKCNAVLGFGLDQNVPC